MRKFGIIGKPLEHSYSAKYFTEKFIRDAIDAEYKLYEIDNLSSLPELMAELDGFNVTYPYKMAIMPHLRAIDPIADAIGAVNVVKVSKEGLIGYNSDVIGFVNSIRPLLKPHHKKALILGTGGASKAIHYGLEEKLGMETLFVSRTARQGMITYEEVTTEVLKEYEVIVNCSPAGMFPHVDECPALPYEDMNERHLLYDLVYNPLETLFMKKGATMGACVKNGLEMLHLQALESWRIWND